MEEKDQEKGKEHQTFETMINLELRGKLSYDCVFTLQQLQKLCKSGHSNQLIKTANSCKLSDRSDICLALKQEVKGDNRNQVNYEPTFEVVNCNLLAAINLQHCIYLTVGGVEGNQNVYAETDINQSVNYFPVLAIIVEEANSVGHSYADEDQLKEDKKVPADLNEVSLRNDILGFAVDDGSFCSIESCEF